MTDVAAPCLSIKYEWNSFEELINLLKARASVLMLNVPIVSSFISLLLPLPCADLTGLSPSVTIR